MTRSQVVVVQGAQSGSPAVVGLFDHAGTMIDRDRVPLSMNEARDRIAGAARVYGR